MSTQSTPGWLVAYSPSRKACAGSTAAGGARATRISRAFPARVTRDSRASTHAGHVRPMPKTSRATQREAVATAKTKRKAEKETKRKGEKVPKRRALRRPTHGVLTEGNPSRVVARASQHESLFCVVCSAGVSVCACVRVCVCCVRLCMCVRARACVCACVCVRARTRARARTQLRAHKRTHKGSSLRGTHMGYSGYSP